jgi:hypothetical protein
LTLAGIYNSKGGENTASKRVSTNLNRKKNEMAQAEDFGEARVVMDGLMRAARKGGRQQIKVCAMRVSS